MDEREVNSALAEISRRRVLAAGALGARRPGATRSPWAMRLTHPGRCSSMSARTPRIRQAEAAIIPSDFRSSGSMRRRVHCRRSKQVQSANPSFVALHPSRRFLYVINEIDDYEGQKSGSAEAYAIDPATGMIKLLNRQPLNSPIPAHLAADPTGLHLVVANYIGGDFVVLPIEADGRLGPVSGDLKDTGSGPNEKRQEAPHPHSVVFDPAGRFIAAADLGIDKVQVFRLSDGGLTRVSEGPVAPGAGPRHIAFDLGGKRFYVVNELNATVTGFFYDPVTGQIGNILQTISTEPAGYDGPHSTAEIALHPSGKFLYASNRGHNSIVGYRIDPSTGVLSVIGFATQGVNFPRNFAIDPSGKWLYVANQKGDTIVQFEINPETGELKPTGQVTPSVTSVAIVFRTAGQD